jgi:hypothetical protein
MATPSYVEAHIVAYWRTRRVFQAETNFSEDLYDPVPHWLEESCRSMTDGLPVLSSRPLV